MFNKKQLLLPADGNFKDLPYEDRKEAIDILLTKMKEEHDSFEGLFDFALSDLFDRSDKGDGFHPWQYKTFIQWVFKQMLVPSNAEALEKKLAGKGGQYLQKIMDFFDLLSEEETSNTVWAFCEWYNLDSYMRGISDSDFYFLWQTYVNPKQPSTK